MMVIIIGENRVELNKIKKKDYNKLFFERRDQVYKVCPDGLVHLRIKDRKGKVTDEECVVFKENASIPYDVLPGVSYRQDHIFEELDLVRDVNRGKFFKRNTLMHRVNEVTDAIYPILGVGILAGVLLWVAVNLITGGSRCSGRTRRSRRCSCAACGGRSTRTARYTTAYPRRRSPEPPSTARPSM